MRTFAEINKYHVGHLPYLMDRLREIEEGDTHLLDKTMILYGSPMADSNLHNHRRCPLIALGAANGKLEGNLHVKAADGTPMANAMLTPDAQAGARGHHRVRRQHRGAHALGIAMRSR